MKKLTIEPIYFMLLIGLIIIAVMAFFAGRVYEEELSCKEIINDANLIVKLCNEKIRECNNIPQEFNLSKFVNLTGVNLSGYS